MLKYAANEFSQNGEDGILQELLRRLDIRRGWVCEFGAWDGKHLSNTFRLIRQGFRGVFIEGDQRKFADLLNTVRWYPKITPVCAFVTESGETSLDSILSRTSIPRDFDVLSIDIDSFDYQVWRGVQVYTPKIVVIEINSSVEPSNLDYIHDGVKYQGTGFGPMLELGTTKGYTLVCHTGNMIFVRNDLVPNLDLDLDTDVISLFLRNWIR